jgi:hypothetical protein
MQAPAVAEAPAQEPEPDTAEKSPEPALPDVKTSEPSEDAAYWRQRFTTLQGMMNAEVGKLGERVKERDMLLQSLQQRLDTLESAKPSEPALQDSKLVTDADVEAYGADLVDMVRRASREEFDALAKKLVAELDKRFGQVAEKVAKTEERVVKSDTDKFWDEVYKAHADFDAVNSDERWFAFLDARIPGTRLTRRATAEQALSTLDSASINELLALFKASVAPAEEPVKAKSKQNLNAQVPPSSSKASSPSEPAQKVWSGAEYAAALDHRNLQRMSREDYERGVAEAEQALAEGRVQF